MKFLSQTGGLVYHGRALRFKKQLWKPFQNQVSSWLHRWNPSSEELILFGPSAGYSLDFEFLNRFRTLICVDPDPIAQVLFRRKLKRDQNLIWIREDFFSKNGKARASDALMKFLKAHPNAAILFCNFLGQFHFLFDQAESQNALFYWRDQFLDLLENRNWASYHDRVSGNVSPSRECLGVESAVFVKRLSDAEILKEFYPKTSSGELIDHQTEDLFSKIIEFEKLEFSYLFWELFPKQFHCVEAVYK